MKTVRSSHDLLRGSQIGPRYLDGTWRAAVLGETWGYEMFLRVPTLFTLGRLTVFSLKLDANGEG